MVDENKSGGLHEGSEIQRFCEWFCVFAYSQNFSRRLAHSYQADFIERQGMQENCYRMREEVKKSEK